MYPILSVIIPAYNCEATIEKCVMSILANKENACAEMEIIAVNDGSKDGTLRCLRELQSRYDCLKVINKENGGVSSARNAGLDAATGKYIYFIDSDDFIAPKILPQVIEHMEKRNVDCCRFCSYNYISHEEAQKMSLQSLCKCEEITWSEVKSANDFLTKEYLKWNFNIFEQIFNIRIIRDNNLRFEENIKFGEDELFLKTYYTYNPTICAVTSKNNFYYYVIWPNSICHSVTKEAIRRKMESILSCAYKLDELKHISSLSKEFKEHLHLRSRWYCYSYFSTCLRKNISSYLQIKERYTKAEQCGLLPIINFHNETGYPSNIPSRIIRWIINHKWLYLLISKARA